MNPESFYHIYNRGNNKIKIFLSERNYLYFLQKVHTFIKPNCRILAWCLMPNHFHFLIYTNSKSTEIIKKHNQMITRLMEGFRNLLSIYTQAFNKQQRRTGSLFTKNTKVKLLDHQSDQPFICFNYIHQNPLRAKLVNKLEDWEFSSFRDYAGKRNGKLCDKALSKEILPINNNNFYQESYQVIEEKWLNELF